MSRQVFHFLMLGGRALLTPLWHYLALGAKSIVHAASVLKQNPLFLFGWMVVRTDPQKRASRSFVPVATGPESRPERLLAGQQTRPILVTGTHRSGTTWVGRMIALAPNVHYIHEPFNPTHDRGVCGAKFDLWFTHVCEQNEAPYYRYLKRAIDLRYSPIQKIRQTRKVGTVPYALKRSIGLARLRLRHPRPLIKGPISLFSAPWLASRFGMDVIVMIRHPAAFASSIKVANWHFPFEHWLNQPLLMEKFLYPFADEIEEQARHPAEVLDQAALLWKCTHHVILSYQATYPDWIFVRHEELSLDPIGGFRQIYQRLGLPFTDGVQKAIAEHSAASNPVGGIEHQCDVKLHSRANLEMWKKRLSAEETLRLRKQVEAVSSRLYPPESWDRN